MSGLDDRWFMPVPQLLLRKASPIGIFYAGIKKFGLAFANDLGPLFEAYVGDELRLLAPGVIDEIEYAEGTSSKLSVDFIVPFEQCVLLVDAKLTRPTEEIRWGAANSGEKLASILNKGIKQLANTARLITDGHPAFAHIPSDRPIIGLLVTMEPFHTVNTPFVSQTLDGCTIPYRVASSEEIEALARLGADDIGPRLLAHLTDPEREGHSIKTLVENRDLGKDKLLDDASTTDARCTTAKATRTARTRTGRSRTSLARTGTRSRPPAAPRTTRIKVVAVMATDRTASPAQAARYLGAVLLIAAGAVHLQQYFAVYYGVIPVIGPLFLANFAIALVLGLALLAPIQRLARWMPSLAAAGGIAFTAGTIIGLQISESGTLLGPTSTATAPRSCCRSPSKARPSSYSRRAAQFAGAVGAGGDQLWGMTRTAGCPPQRASQASKSHRARKSVAAVCPAPSSMSRCATLRSKSSGEMPMAGMAMMRSAVHGSAM